MSLFPEETFDVQFKEESSKEKGKVILQANSLPTYTHCIKKTIFRCFMSNFREKINFLESAYYFRTISEERCSSGLCCVYKIVYKNLKSDLCQPYF